eukprot:scaffold21369_cov100-Phaeocystis_antarctica.AAC.1
MRCTCTCACTCTCSSPKICCTPSLPLKIDVTCPPRPAPRPYGAPPRPPPRPPPGPPLPFPLGNAGGFTKNSTSLSVSEAYRRVVPVAKIVPGAALVISGTPTALAKLTRSVMASGRRLSHLSRSLRVDGTHGLLQWGFASAHRDFATGVLGH